MAPDLYFAYGSNLSSARLLARVPSARARGAARLDGFALRLDKPGADGSGKANLLATPGALVWGVVYQLDPSDWPALDACEPGYERTAVRVALDGAPLAAQTYCSPLYGPGLAAFRWYHRHLVDGAREHGLPEEWIALIEALPVRD